MRADASSTRARSTLTCSVSRGKCAFQVDVEREQRDQEGQYADQPRERMPPAPECPPPSETDERGDESPDDARREALGLARQAFGKAGLLRGPAFAGAGLRYFRRRFRFRLRRFLT